MANDSRETLQASLDKTNAALAKRSQKGYTWWGGGRRSGDSASDLKADTAYWGGLEAQKAKAEAGLKGYDTPATATALSDRGTRTKEMLGVIDRTTDQQYDDIKYSARGRSAAIGQRLARIGMGNTTVGSSLRSGVEREKNQELNRARDYQQQARLGVLGQRAGFAEAEDTQGRDIATRIELGELASTTQLGTANIGSAAQTSAARISAAGQAATARISSAPAMAQERGRQALLRRAGVNYSISGSR